MNITERDYAKRICEVAAQEIVDENGGITMGGIELGEQYANKLYKIGKHSVQDIYKYQQALRHWVDCVGYDSNGEFVIVLSNTIKNC